jgi:hypothetical protein
MGLFIGEETRLMLEMKGIVMLIDMKMLNQKKFRKSNTKFWDKTIPSFQ